MMAMIMSALKDIASDQDATLEALILDFPNFEYLEGEGGRSRIVDTAKLGRQSEVYLGQVIDL
jgi:hypothetical protein